MPKYQLFYWNAKGLAETARLVFAQAGVEYDDVRFTSEEFQSKYKSVTPTGQAPFLKVDDKLIASSMGVARYLAREFGLMGKDNLEAAEIDMWIDLMDDLAHPVMAVHYEKDEKRKEDLKAKYRDETAPKILGTMEKLLNGKKFMVGDNVSLADISLVQRSPWVAFGLQCGESEPFEKYPNLKALRAKVEALPKIAKWLKERPQTEH